ncbi:MAG: leucine--tRNA ligase, partial [Planctomycetota bacterium]
TNEGKSERGNFPVFKRPLKQWMLRITAYADRLIDDLDDVAWPEPIKLLQRNWIGKSIGAEVDFTIHADAEPQSGEASGNTSETIRVFTTRPDTLFGATYMVLAPEHELVEHITTPEQADAVKTYQAEAAAKTSVDRQADKEKTGVFTGAYATNPVNGEPIPIWIADYVMMGYGTGAIMAVPAHDERDFEFAKKFDLPIRRVVKPENWSGHKRMQELMAEGVGEREAKQQTLDEGVSPDTDQPYSGGGTMINSAPAESDGLVPPLDINKKSTQDAKDQIIRALERRGFGKAKVQYRLRDWLFSRQRYWGEPFPILHGPDGDLRAVDEADLPVNLPEMEDFKPTGTDDPDAPPRPPLGRAGDDWINVKLDGQTYTRELNTMPNWAGSCWYYLRYLDPHNADALVGEAAEKYWMVSEKSSGGHHAGGVDLYIGGVEHAVLHLLYARFWHKVLYDLGHVSTPEPFGRLFSQGYIQAYCYRDKRGIPVPAAEVINQEGKPAADVQGTKNQKFFHNDQPVTEEFGKMGKSLKNAVAPDEVCEQYGCDTLRLYEMYLGPLDQSKIWNTNDIVGVHRFLNRLWRNFVDEATGESRITHDNPSDELERATHNTIKRVTEAMDSMSFNVAIAALIELNNALVKLPGVPKWVGEVIARLLAPLAPHIAEELWERLGHYVPNTTVADAPWPDYNPEILVEDKVEYPVQVMGKMRGKITVSADADEDAIVTAAKAEANVAVHLEGKTIRKVIVVPGRMVNLIAN